jgi:hypothetical protein
MIWYLPHPNRWILCEIVSELLGHITVRTYQGETISGLKKRRINGAAWLLEKRS